MSCDSDLSFIAQSVVTQAVCQLKWLLQLHRQVTHSQSLMTHCVTDSEFITGPTVTDAGDALGASCSESPQSNFTGKFAELAPRG